MRWLKECSPAAVAVALQTVAPELNGQEIVIREWVGGDPQWWAVSVIVGEQFIAKFAWPHPAALRLAEEIHVLSALADEPRVALIPEVVASSTARNFWSPGACLVRHCSTSGQIRSSPPCAGATGPTRGAPSPYQTVLAPGDLHGGNQVCDAGISPPIESWAWHRRTTLDDAVRHSEGG